MPFPWQLLTGAAQLARALRDSHNEAEERAERRRQQWIDFARHVEDRDDVTTVPRQYVVGTALTSGIVIAANASTVEKVQVFRHRRVETLTLLSGGPLARLDAAWIDDKPAPIVADTGQTPPVRVWGTTGWTLAKRVIQYRYYDLLGAGPLRARFEVLRARMDALVPNWRPTTEGAPLVIPSRLNTVTRDLFDDLLAEYDALLTSAAFGDWQDKRKRRVNDMDVPLNEPAAWIRLSLGTPEDEAATSAVQTYATTHIPGWKATDVGRGMGWAITSYRYWREGGRIKPWTTVPPARYLATGADDYDGNAAKLARAVYLQADREPSDLEGLDDAIRRCGELITIPAMTYSTTPDSTAPLDWATYRAYLWPDGDYPPTAEEQRVLAEVNARIAGSANAKMRYGLNGVFTSDQINSGEAISIAAERMGGHFVELPGKRIAFRPASPRATVFTSTPATRVQGATLRTVGGTDATNALVARIDQDSDRQYRSSTTPRSELATLVERDGLAVKTRRARGIGTQIEAMRQNAFILDVESPDKRVVEWAEIVTNPTDARGLCQPDDLVAFETPHGNSTVRIDTVQPQHGKVVYTGREIDSDWADDKYFATPIDRDPGPGGTAGLDLSGNMVVRFRQTASGRVCDVELFLGLDVDEVEVEATWREREASTPPVADDVQHYRFAGPPTGAWFVHTVKDSAGPVSTIVPDDVDDNVFEGTRNRELELRVVPRGDGLDGPELGGIIVPGDVGAAVRILGVREDRIGSGPSFAGWLVQVLGIEVLDGSLVFSWDGGSTWAAPRHYAGANPSIPDAETICTRDTQVGPTGRKTLVIPNSFDLGSGEVTLTLGACTGACPSPPAAAPAPYVFAAPSDTTFQVESGTIVDINKYVRPEDLTVQFADTPTVAGTYVGQLGYVIEEEA